MFNVVRGVIKLYKLLPDGRRQITGFLFPGDFLGTLNSEGTRLVEQRARRIEKALRGYGLGQASRHP